MIVSLAVESRQPIRDLLWMLDEHPSMVATLTEYLGWRADQMKRR
jgi:hypothetical protein